ncbi:MAG: bifunctional nuclease family protein [Nitrosarchaeum sp.]
MNIQSTLKNNLDSLWKKITHAKYTKIQITDLDEDFDVTIDNVGITDFCMGAVILKTNDGKKFPISVFSVDVAKYISDFQEGKRGDIPSMYNMIEQVYEESGLLLVKVRIYDSGEALRANLYFTGKKEVVLRNHRASDAIALATFYSIPIFIKKSLLQPSPQIPKCSSFF